MSRLAVLALIHRPERGLASLLKSTGFEAVAEGSTLDDLVEGAKGQPSPDVLLVNLSPSVTEISSLM